MEVSLVWSKGRTKFRFAVILEFLFMGKTPIAKTDGHVCDLMLCFRPVASCTLFF